jgi:hypothetical protein
VDVAIGKQCVERVTQPVALVDGEIGETLAAIHGDVPRSVVVVIRAWPFSEVVVHGLQQCLLRPRVSIGVQGVTILGQEKAPARPINPKLLVIFPFPYFDGVAFDGVFLARRLGRFFGRHRLILFR